MALASLILVFIIIGCILLALAFIGGLVFLIAGIVSRKKPKNTGKKFPAVFIAIGSLMLLFPAVTVIFFAAGGIASQISTSVNSRSYTNAADKWRNERVTDKAAAKEAIEGLLSAADSEDHEQFANLFTPNIRQSQGFDREVDDFFKSYPKGLGSCELEGGNVSSSGSYNYGHNVQRGSTHYTCFLDGKWYAVSMTFCYENTDFPNDVGVDFFCIENLEAYALDEDHNSEYLICSIKSEDDVSAKLINNRAFIFEPYPERIITEEQMVVYLEEYEDLRQLSKEIGKPNVTIKYDNCTGYDHYYELAPENGEPRYAYICTSSYSGDFLYGYVCSDTDHFYDRKLVTRKE